MRSSSTRPIATSTPTVGQQVGVGVRARGHAARGAWRGTPRSTPSGPGQRAQVERARRGRSPPRPCRRRRAGPPGSGIPARGCASSRGGRGPGGRSPVRGRRVGAPGGASMRRRLASAVAPHQARGQLDGLALAVRADDERALGLGGAHGGGRDAGVLPGSARVVARSTSTPAARGSRARCRRAPPRGCRCGSRPRRGAARDDQQHDHARQDRAAPASGGGATGSSTCGGRAAGPSRSRAGVPVDASEHAHLARSAAAASGRRRRTAGTSAVPPTALAPAPAHAARGRRSRCRCPRRRWRAPPGRAPPRERVRLGQDARRCPRSGT